MFGAYLSSRKEMTAPCIRLATVPICIYVYMQFYFWVIFALQHPPSLNKEERERALRSGGSVRS